MNTGELLVSLSGLPSGSALTHLQAITTGTGAGETIYADKLYVTAAQQRITYTQRAKRTTESPQAAQPAPRSSSKPSKYAYAYTEHDLLYVTSKTSVTTCISKSNGIFRKMNSETVL